MGAAAEAIAVYGPAAFEYSDKLIPAIRRALIHQADVIHDCLACLAAIHPDPESLLAGRLDDPELYREASETLSEMRGAGAEVFDDDDLIEIIRSGVVARQIATASRKSVSSAVSGALVETGKLRVITSLLDNDGAEIVEADLSSIIDQFGDERQQLLRNFRVDHVVRRRE